MADFIVASICLNDVPQSAIVQANNGKKYLNFIVSKRQTVGQYGHTHTIYLSQTQEERNAKADKVYIGDGKEHVTQFAPTQESAPSAPSAAPIPETDDLPW